ncbi:hypothetical protein BT69DRAFT_1285473 [Atractiella rhizophila]|nr:hypothetical protein BT69DRAFT_1285473 [Atractiella rhizophila]
MCVSAVYEPLVLAPNTRFVFIEQINKYEASEQSYSARGRREDGSDGRLDELVAYSGLGVHSAVLDKVDGLNALLFSSIYHHHKDTRTSPLCSLRGGRYSNP